MPVNAAQRSATGKNEQKPPTPPSNRHIHPKASESNHQLQNAAAISSESSPPADNPHNSNHEDPAQTLLPPPRPAVAHPPQESHPSSPPSQGAVWQQQQQDPTASIRQHLHSRRERAKNLPMQSLGSDPMMTQCFSGLAEESKRTLEGLDDLDILASERQPLQTPNNVPCESKGGRKGRERFSMGKKGYPDIRRQDKTHNVAGSSPGFPLSAARMPFWSVV